MGKRFIDLKFHKDDDNFDLDTFKEEFEKEYQEEQTEETTEEETTEPEEEEQTEEETTEEQPPEGQDKDAKAFANMRNQLKDKEQYEGFVKKIADQYGVKPEELMQRFEEQQLQQQAKEQNTNPEVLKRVRDLEQQNENLSRQQMNERLNTQIQNVMRDYGIKDNNDPTMQKTFEHIANNHLDSNNMPTIGFDEAYKIANYDTIIEQKVEAARQKDLEDKKQRQQQTAVPNGDGETTPSNDMSMDEVEKTLKKMDLLD